jgi:hypothetical protein
MGRRPDDHYSFIRTDAYPVCKMGLYETVLVHLMEYITSTSNKWDEMIDCMYLADRLVPDCRSQVRDVLRCSQSFILSHERTVELACLANSQVAATNARAVMDNVKQTLSINHECKVDDCHGAPYAQWMDLMVWHFFCTSEGINERLMYYMYQLIKTHSVTKKCPISAQHYGYLVTHWVLVLLRYGRDKWHRVLNIKPVWTVVRDVLVSVGKKCRYHCDLLYEIQLCR